MTTAIPNLAGGPVLLKNGATTANVAVTSGFVPYSGAGTVNVSGSSGAVLVVDGAASHVRLGP